MAYVGPVMSYYETITENWDRLTDERWKETIQNDDLPQRPDWVNVYLTDKSGSARISGRELAGRAYTSANDSQQNLPEVFSLAQNYPNPFNPITTIKFNLTQNAHVTLTVYNILGQVIITLIDGQRPAGTHYITWDGKNQQGNQVASGIYFCKIAAGDFVQIRKMILSR